MMKDILVLIPVLLLIMGLILSFLSKGSLFKRIKFKRIPAVEIYWPKSFLRVENKNITCSTKLSYILFSEKSDEEISELLFEIGNKYKFNNFNSNEEVFRFYYSEEYKNFLDEVEEKMTKDE